VNPDGQRDWYWAALLFMFFLEREFMVDTAFMILEAVFRIFG